jgi:ABC-2 type transport system permease protein
VESSNTAESGYEKGMSTIIRYLRLFGYFVAFSFSKSFEFRFDFFARILMDVLYYGVAISFFQIMFLHTPTLGGWTEPQMMIFVGAYCMVDAINMTLFSNNLWMIPVMVNRGDLDYYLIRPVSSLFFVSFRDFAANSFVNLLITFGILAWAMGRYPEPLSAGKFALFLLLILNGNLIFYCLGMLATLPVFFTQSSSGFSQLIWNLMKFGERPDRIFTGWVRRILVTILPFSLIASFPTRVFLEKLDVSILLHTIVVSVILFTVTLWAWSKSLSRYASASS